MKKIISGLVVAAAMLVFVGSNPAEVYASEIVGNESAESIESTNNNDIIEKSNVENNKPEANKAEESIITNEAPNVETINEGEVVDTEVDVLNILSSNQEESTSVDKYSSKDDKIKHIISESFKKCPVCKSEDEHQKHMVHDEELREYLFYPDKYFEEKEKTKFYQFLENLYKAFVKSNENQDDTDTNENPEDLATTEEAGNTEEQATIEAIENLEGQATSETTDNSEEPSDAEITNDVEILEEVDTINDKEAPEEVVESLKENKANQNTTLENVDPELDVLYRLVESEAGIESSRCKELVAGVVLNRVKSDRFPNSIHDVIYAPGAFAVTNNNAINRVKVTQETVDAVNRVYYGQVQVEENVYFFRNNHFFSWCKPVKSINHTYFSTFYK